VGWGADGSEARAWASQASLALWSIGQADSPPLSAIVAVMVYFEIRRVSY
jgi:hypothetical protein